MKLEINEQNASRINNLLQQIPTSCNWIASEVIIILNNCEIKEEKEDENNA